MARLSKRQTNLKRSAEFERFFYELIGSLGSSTTIEIFFKDLLTPTETRMLAKRLQVALLLLQGASYEFINTRVGVSDSTIARVNNRINFQAYHLRKFLLNLLPQKDSDDYEPPPRSGYYLAGNLLSPLVDEGFRYLNKRLKLKKY